MMNRLSQNMTRTAIGAAILLLSSAVAFSQNAQTGTTRSKAQSKSGMPKEHGMMGMSEMNREPHHMLAMAYHDSMITFAKALRQEASRGTAVNPDFARAAVDEMKRSFAQMQQHHQEHVKTMDVATTASMADRMTKMDASHAAIKEQLAVLDTAVHAAAPDSKTITTAVTAILSQSDQANRMHGAPMTKNMGGTKKQKTN